jgi:3',5'-cyclic AMP phosphodiesterase CpdA
VRLRILSDLHLEIWPIELPPADADVVILAGDIDNGAKGINWASRSFDAPVLYVPGNHEPYDGEFWATQTAMRDAARGTRVELLECGERVIAGVRFLGCALWTDYSLVPEAGRPAIIEAARKINPDYRVIRHGEGIFAPEDAIALHREHRAWLAQALERPFEGTTVVVTHFAPHPGSIAPAYASDPSNPGFVVNLESMMGRAPLWIHGHTHTFFDYNASGTRIVCNPRGYPKEPTGFRPDFVVSV